MKMSKRILPENEEGEEEYYGESDSQLQIL
jgi:hypothetical protein